VQTLPPLQLGMGSEAGRHIGDGSKGEVKSQVLWTRLVGVARVYFIKKSRRPRKQAAQTGHPWSNPKQHWCNHLNKVQFVRVRQISQAC